MTKRRASFCLLKGLDEHEDQRRREDADGPGRRVDLHEVHEHRHEALREVGVEAEVLRVVHAEHLGSR